MSAPSFNYNKQSGADGADHVDLGTLRGLGPDQTLDFNQWQTSVTLLLL